MKYTAVDSFYTSETKQVHARQEFTAEDFDLSKSKISELEKKGLITASKAADAPDNKAEPAPANKAEKPASNKDK